MTYFLESGRVDEDLHIAQCEHGHHPDGCARCDLIRTERVNRRASPPPWEAYLKPQEAPKEPAWIGWMDYEGPKTQAERDAAAALLGVSVHREDQSLSEKPGTADGAESLSEPAGIVSR